MEPAQKFLEEIKGQELSPAFHNAALFLQASGWNTNRYLRDFYDDKTSYPILFTVKKDEGIFYLPVTKHKRLAEEMFKKYWIDSTRMNYIDTEFKKYADVIDSIHHKLSHQYVQSNSIETLLVDVETCKDSTWNMNALCLFSLYFDKDMCLKLLREVGSHITESDLEKLWERATVPLADSFEKRRSNYATGLIAGALSSSEIAERCQYFEAAYNKISSLEDVSASLQKNYGNLKNPKQAAGVLEEQEAKKKQKYSEYDLWLASLANEEGRLVIFLQKIIELRDVRKDYIAKTLVAAFRVTQRLFKEADVSEDLIYFARFSEIMKGRDYIKEHSDTFKKRMNGYSLFVAYDGSEIEEYGPVDKNKHLVDKVFLQQQRQNEPEKIRELKGQIGSPGRVKGKVKIIKNIDTEQDKFKDGEILVTGMTRPEFVPLMKHAAAIITDEGGITCHAAIVSRELGLPCIIGTKIATKMLQDGDLVEVDADQGVVYILDQSAK